MEVSDPLQATAALPLQRTVVHNEHETERSREGLKALKKRKFPTEN
jgi:hypothetical protein